MCICCPGLGATYLTPTRKGEVVLAASFDPSCSVPLLIFCTYITISAKTVLSPWIVYDGYLKTPGLLIVMLGYQWSQAAPCKLCNFLPLVLTLVKQDPLSRNH